MKACVQKNYDKMISDFFNDADIHFDSSCGLISTEVKEKNVIHTNVIGLAHFIRTNSIYAQLVYMNGIEERYADAENIIGKIIAAQDTNPESRTYGLWPYYFEESLEQMSAPDYNMAEFISSSLIYIVLEKSDLLKEELVCKIKECLGRAAKCCINRNVGLDYTNVIAMSCFTLLAIGEILDDKTLLKKGKDELEKFCEYTRFNGGFSEYNSPCYFKITGEVIGRMLKYFKDEESLKMARELNDYLWEMVSTHYSSEFGELTPPYVRAYEDLDTDKMNSDFIYYATDGEYGAFNNVLSELYFNVPPCPEKYYKNFDNDFWLENRYYKKNDLRRRDTDVTVIRDFESPDLVAYSNKNKDYLFGALQKTELWDQRRTSMLIWDKEDKKTFKLRCMKDGFSFSSGMSYTALGKDEEIILVGFSTDHGDKHYILDLFENGKIRTEKLAFTMKLSDNCDKSKMVAYENGIRYKDDLISFDVKIARWVFDGKPGEIRFTDDGFELVCCDGDEREINLEALKDTYGVITMKINGVAPSVKLTENDERIIIEHENGSIDGYKKPQPYNNCIRNTVVKKGD